MSRTRGAVLKLGACLVAFVVGGCEGEPETVSGFVEHRGPSSDANAQGDVFTPDTSAPDAVLPDTATSDTRPDSVDAAADTTQPDTTVADTSQPDTTAADTSQPDTTVADTGPETQDTTPETVQPELPVGPVDINTGFIGGACQADAQCAFAGGDCKVPVDGYPNGMCTQSCTQFCPDQAGLVTTFCIDGVILDEAGGMCVSKCDLGRSDSGCRDGYTCTEELRVNQERIASWVCLPGEWTVCLQELIVRGVDFTLPASTTMESPSGLPNTICDIYEHVQVAGVINGVNFRPSNFTNAPSTLKVQCGVALALWDMAELAKTRGITDFVHYGTYNCRTISGTNTLSQHAYANAIDIAGVQTSTGARYTLLSHWEYDTNTPTTPGGQLLYWLAHTMHDQQMWNIILTPEYNAAHADHFHIDLTPGSWFLSE